MTVPAWQNAKLYQNGAVVVPRTTLPPGPAPIVNGGFDADADGWLLLAHGTNASIAWSPTGGYSSPGCITTSGSTVDAEASVTDVDEYPVTVGQSITVQAYTRQTSGSGPTGARAVLQWIDASGNDMTPSIGSMVVMSSGTQYRVVSHTAWAPSGAAKVRASIYISHNDNPSISTVLVDSISWNYRSPNTGLMYRAVQPNAGLSGSVEPVWPSVLGQQVVDNEVIWEAISISRVVWEAQPILKTGTTEPVWPTDIGTSVPDGTISWKAVNPITADDNCPHTRVVAIAEFKIFAADKDVVRFTATLAPQDWTSEKDAGYLGVGLNQGSANHVSLLNLYRANLVVMNPVMFQQWQIDPDPQLMDMLDRMDGIGSSWHLAAAPVADDLFYLSSRGVRTVGVSGATNNLKSGDIGLPVDPIISALTSELVERNAAGENEQPLGMYLPGMGQYWLSYNRIVPADGVDGPAVGSPRDLCPTLDVGDRYAEVMVYTITQVGQVGAWSRYVFPFAIDDWTQEGDDLFVRDGDRVFRLSEDLGAVDNYIVDAQSSSAFGDPFEAIFQWPWLDMGRPGQDKQMQSFDFVGYGNAEIEFGFDQSEPGYFTAPYALPPDTLPAQAIPMELTAPSYSVRVRYHGWDPSDPETEPQRHWAFNALAINYL